MLVTLRRGGLAAAILAVLTAAALAPDARAGFKAGLCKSTGARVAIPSSFFVDACFDGSSVILHNQSHFALRVARGGSAGRPNRTQTSYTLPALATRRINSSPDLLLPSEIVSIPIGAAAATVGVTRAKSDPYYAIAAVFAGKLKLPKTAKVIATFTDFMSEVNDAFVHYQGCKASSSRVRRATCVPVLTHDMTFAATRGTVLAVLQVGRSAVTAIVEAVVSTITSVNFAYEHTAEYPALKRSPTLSFAAASQPAVPPPAPPPAPDDAPPPPAARPAPASGGTPASAPPAPNVPAGSRGQTTGGVTNTWTNYTNAGGSQGPSIPARQTVGVACKVQGFRVANGNTWWYRIAASPWNHQFYASADAFYNNGQTSGSLQGTPWVDPSVPDCAPPPAPAPATYAETTGGVTNTWSNHTNAGDTKGPTIASNQTVQIACKLQGFRVANGNTWWYRIAQSPWNHQFYASADAFYNNGQTSGSLRGTPWVDPNVRDC